MRDQVIDGAARLAVAARENGRWLAEQVIDKVRVMNVQVQERAARQLAVAVPTLGHAGDTADRDAEDFSVALFSDSRLQPIPLGPEPQAHRRHEEPLGLARGVGDLPCDGRGPRERLFADHVLARRERGRRELQVVRRRGADIDDVDLGMVQDLEVIRRAEDARHVELLHACAEDVPLGADHVAVGAMGVAITDSADFDIGQERVRLEVRAPHHSHPDDSDVEHSGECFWFSPWSMTRGKDIVRKEKIQFKDERRGEGANLDPDGGKAES